MLFCSKRSQRYLLQKKERCLKALVSGSIISNRHNLFTYFELDFERVPTFFLPHSLDFLTTCMEDDMLGIKRKPKTALKLTFCWLCKEVNGNLYELKEY